MSKARTSGRDRRLRAGEIERHVFSGRTWSTRRPIALPDRVGASRAFRASGSYGFRVLDADRFASTLGPRRRALTSRRLSACLSARIAERIESILRRVVRDVDELPLLFNEVATEARLELKQEFAGLGVDLIDFFVASIRAESTPATARESGRRRTTSSPRTAWTGGGARERRNRPAAADGPVSTAPLRLPEICPVCGADTPGRNAVCPRCGARRKGGRPD